MDEQRSPGERVLDLVVFGPAGLALTAVEEFPKLVDKGRHHLEGQVRTARLVGQVAVQNPQCTHRCTIAAASAPAALSLMKSASLICIVAPTGACDRHRICRPDRSARAGAGEYRPALGSEV